jgi:L-asparagine permease
MNMIGVKWFAEMEFWFALVKVLAIVAFLVVGTVFLAAESRWTAMPPAST